MPLPDDPKQPWPPRAWADIQRDLTEADAWYSGDPDKLTAFYGGPVRKARAGGESGWSRFWSRRSNDQATARQRIHVPAAADIAATSADLLFGDEPRITIPEAHEETAEGDAKATEDRLVEILDADGLASTLLEGAEVCAGISGVYLRPAWDPTLANHPMLTVVHADHAVPEFRWGKLVAVTFWREITGDGGVWRHLERHEPGRILHGLYFGDADHLGVRRALGDLPDTAGIDADEIRLPGGIGGLDVRYVPNVRPNRKHRGKPVGRSDTAGSESLMDGLDETMTSWLRDIRLGKARIVVPEEFLERDGRGRGASFDVDAEVFSPLNMDPGDMYKAGITPVEFKIRTEEHARTIAELFERVVVTAGYSPQTFGLQGDGAEQTATEVDAREGRSLRTTARKQRYWRAALEDVLEMVLAIDADLFASGITPMRPRVEFAEPAGDPRKVAETIELLRRAQAASTETLVRMAQPDLEGEELAAEVERVLDETSMAVPDPTGGLP